MAARRSAKTSFWTPSRSGPWPEAMLARVRGALDAIATAVRTEPDVLALMVFGSYARGDYGRKSDLDLLVLFSGRALPERSPVATRVRKVIGEAEATQRLPIHLAPLLAAVEDRATLTNELLYDIWRDGIVLYARSSALALLRPQALAPWAIFRYSARGSASDRVRLSRKLHGLTKGSGGVVRPPALTLARGAVLVPAVQEQEVRAALDEVGATYDHIPVWREA